MVVVVACRLDRVVDQAQLDVEQGARRGRLGGSRR